MAQSNRVICIRDTWYKGTRPVSYGPKKDNVYTIVTVVGYQDETYYVLKEFPSTEQFNVKGFRELDDFGEKVCARIESEMEQVKSPFIALFCLMVNLHSEQLKHIV